MKVTAMTMTCGACPSQWEGRLEDGRHLYVRYRHGHLRAGVGETLEAAVSAAMGLTAGSTSIYYGKHGDEHHGVMDTETMLRLTGLDLAPDAGREKAR